MTIINYSDLTKIREENIDKKIGLCIGVFDLAHAGHVLFFEDCKKYCDILVVAVGNDSFIKSYKGDSRPIFNESIRLKIIDSLKPVDYTFLEPTPKWEGEKTHHLMLPPIFKSLKPNFYIVNEDGPGNKVREEITKNFNVKFVLLNRECPKEFDNISTTKIIDRIKSLKD